MSLPPEFTGSAQFCYLVPTGPPNDERQDAYLALLEADPKTETDALDILSKSHHRAEYQSRMDRQRSLPLLCEPATSARPAPNGPAVAALESLPDEDRQLITDHVLNGTSLRAIAKAAGVSKDTIRKRYDRAKQKLAALVQKQ